MEQHSTRWVIEYAWAHNMIDVFQDVSDLHWPDVDSSPLSLDESWHVRVTSAQVYSIVKRRQIHHYDRVLDFLEHIHSLLPTLVPAIKHMKIVFGLKTMVIVWMLKEGTGLIGVVQKILKYFPSKLPQYEDQCRKHEMFLMRKNQLDFRTFAESLVMDKQKLEDFIQNHVEEQYGDHYAQRTEDRLLHYLRELDKALPKCTYIDMIMKKSSPIKEWEKFLLDLITGDSTTTASSLKALLRSGAACCDSFSKSHMGTRSAAEETSLQLDSPATDTRTIDIKVSRKKLALALQTDQSTTVSATEADDTEDRCLGNCSTRLSAHFCSKHQRWVSNILSECPGELSEERQRQNSEISPSLFTSTPSSSDLTPSNLTISPEQHHQDPSASNKLQEVVEDPETRESHVSEPADIEPPLPSAPPAADSFVPGGRVLEVVIVPCEYVTPVTVRPVKSTATTTTTSNFAEMSMRQRATCSKASVSTFSRRSQRRGRRFSQSHNAENPNKEDAGGQKVQLSTSATDSSSNARNYSPAQASSIDHVANTHDGTLSSCHMRPFVVLMRMSVEECLKITKGRLQHRQYDDMEEHRDPDVYSFHSDSSSSSPSSSSSEEEEADSDTEYKPCKKTLRKWSKGLLPF